MAVMNRHTCLYISVLEEVRRDERGEVKNRGETYKQMWILWCITGNTNFNIFKCLIFLLNIFLTIYFLIHLYVSIKSSSPNKSRSDYLIKKLTIITQLVCNWKKNVLQK